MSDALRALLNAVIDYAGLFPPAQLPLDEVVRRYADYRRGPDARMLGRLVIPAARLPELTRYVSELFAEGPPLSLAVLGRPAERMADWLAGLRVDMEEVAHIRAVHEGRVRVDGFEARLPPEALVEGVRPAVGVLGSLPAFVEMPGGVADRAAVGAVVGGLVPAGAGFKLRCGGTSAASFPSAEQVAFVLCACRDAGVPLKLTAGLHHPLPRFDPSIGATMHGFVNVFTAGVLAAAGADEATVTELLRDAEPGHFAFDSELRWKDRTATAAEVAAARRSGVLSFGSCSFDEPRDDLRALGWL
jgi:hypothetical protein